ncbi:MAG: TRAP-type C4-dicarboxylate transport system substrate-binding protein [Oceanicoccus sp.]|jgi:TRAP-type C4-dicarboxylate transport system substrate-binding protein
MQDRTKRAFLQHCLKLGIGSILSGGMFPYDGAWASNIENEQRKQQLAKYQFNFNSPYFTSSHEYTAHAHHEIKQIIEETTKHQIHVQINEGGINGIGSRLVNGVSYHRYQGALLSASNLSPKIKELDLLNIPYWSASTENYIRLINSSIWQKHVLDKAAQHKIKIMFHYLIGERTATTIKSYKHTFKSPEDFNNVQFRVPNSNNLRHMYKIANAQPLDIHWGLCAENARQGRYQALDPSIIGLYSGPDNLKQEIGSISKVETVHDSWIAIANTDFIDALDSKVKVQFLDALQLIQAKQFEQYQKANQLCEAAFIKQGTLIYTPTKNELQAFERKFGHENPIWDQAKKELLGENGIALFDQFVKAAKG